MPFQVNLTHTPTISHQTDPAWVSLEIILDGFLPVEILVSQDEAKLILEPIAEQLGIKLTTVTTCKEANRARKEFVKFMARR